MIRTRRGRTLIMELNTNFNCYISTIEPKIRNKSNLQILDKVQNQALRIITGAMKSTPIAAMEEVTGIQPLNQDGGGELTYRP